MNRNRLAPRTLCALLVVLACTEHSETALEPSGAKSGAASPVLLAVGDIAGCPSGYKDEAVSNLVSGISGTIALLGDLVYDDGTTKEFQNCYAPSWGRHLSRSRPAPGNHEYHTSNASPYYNYFGSRAGPAGKGYYTFTLGSWRIYSLNSERNLSAQASWLKSQLAAHPSKCVLAFWHKPLFTSGKNSPETAMRPLFTVLYNAGAEIVLNAHNHGYDRFAPQDPSGKAASRGIRQFVVGTGGSKLYGFGSPRRNSQVRYAGGHGVLKLDLGGESYSWRYVSVPGKSFTDSGSGSCR